MKVLRVIMVVTLCVNCRKQPSPTVFIDPALAVLIPSDTTLLAGIRMQRIKAAPFYNESVAQSSRLMEFRASVGLTQDSDVWEYLITSNGEAALVLMRGKFTEMGMEPRVNKSSARRSTYQGINILGDEEGAIAFLNPTTAIAGRFTVVLRALERRNQNTGIPESLERLAQQIPSIHEAWLVSIGPAPDFLAVPRLRTARAGFDPKSRRLDLMVEADSSAEARAIAERVNGRADENRVVYEGPAPADVLDWILKTDGFK